MMILDTLRVTRVQQRGARSQSKFQVRAPTKYFFELFNVILLRETAARSDYSRQ